MKVLNNSLMRAERMFGSRSIECNVINPLVGAALVSGGAGILSGLFGSHSKAKAQREANATNLQIARENNQTQIDMNRENNQFSAEEAEKAWNRQVDMFNMENEYNTPAAQRARMEEAGFNPFVGQSGSMAYGAAADGGGAPAASAGTSGISPVMSQVQPVPSVWNGISDALLEGASTVANAYANMAQAEKAGVETETLKRVMDAEVQLKQANADWWRMNADLYSKYGNLEMSKKMATMDENLNNIIADTGKKIKEGILSYEQAMKTIEETGFWKEAKELKGKEKQFFQAKLDRVSEFVQNEIDEGKARINELDTRSQANVAAANYSNQQAHDLAATLQARIKNLDAQSANQLAQATLNGTLNNMRDLEYTIRKGSKYTEIISNKLKFLEQAKQAGLITHQELLRVQRERSRNKTYWLDYTWNKAREALATVTAAIPGSASVDTGTDTYDGWNSGYTR